MEKINKQKVIDTVKIAVTRQEISFRGPRLLEMWRNGRIYLPSAEIEKDSSLRRLAYELRGDELLKKRLCLYDKRIAAVVDSVSKELSCRIDFSADDKTTVDDLCNAFLAALGDRLQD